MQAGVLGTVHLPCYKYVFDTEVSHGIYYSISYGLIQRWYTHEFFCASCPSCTTTLILRHHLLRVHVACALCHVQRLIELRRNALHSPPSRYSD